LDFVLMEALSARWLIQNITLCTTIHAQVRNAAL